MLMLHSLLAHYTNSKRAVSRQYWQRGERRWTLPVAITPSREDGFGVLIPLGRMAHHDEYKTAAIFLVCDDSSYMTRTFIR